MYKNTYRMLSRSLLILIFPLISVNSLEAQHSVARQWNEALLHAIRHDFARPTVHARNLWHVSVVMYDAWAAYTPAADCYFLGDTVGDYHCAYTPIGIPANPRAAQEEAMSYAAYRLLTYKFQNSPGAFTALNYFDSLFTHLGYSPADTSTNYSAGSPAALGNYIAREMIFFGLQDGSNEQNGFSNTSYSAVNPGLAPIVPGNPNISDPNRWQPLTLNVYIDQSGNVIPINTPPFLGPEWGSVVPFALDSTDGTTQTRNGYNYKIFHDPGHPPYIDTTQGATANENYMWNFRLVSKWSSHLDTADGVMWDISPASMGNVQTYPTNHDSLKYFYNEDNGGDPGTGYAVNPVTGQPYTPQMVPRGDYTRVLAEFWADGPDSETPPGHWFTILNYVSDHPQFTRKWEGDGPVMDDLEWDIKAYFTLSGAMHDAAVSAWGVKGWYDYLRPISALRYMADKGQSTYPNLPNYHKNGIPLDSGFVELVDSNDALAGSNYENVWKVKVRAWAGPDSVSNPLTDMAGVSWILLENWWPYQRPSFVTPPFAGYVSGHSTFSRAAAEILTSITGDAYFPGGMGEFVAEKNKFLVFEEGPSRDITLQWATYRDASDQCSLSRIWGGIHPPCDDIPGRLMGMEIGWDAFNLAQTYWENGIPDVTDLEVSAEMITDTLAGNARFAIEVEFDSFMDTLHIPQLSFPVEDPLANTLAFNSTLSGWKNKYTYSAWYDVTDADEDLRNIDISVNGGRAADGTAQSAYTEIDQFSIDMQSAGLVLNFTPSVVADSDAGTAKATLMVTYSEPMDTTFPPLISFPHDDPQLQSLQLNADSTGWMDDKVYRFSWDVSDMNETLHNITVNINSSRDTNGNENQNSYSKLFYLDTENPLVSVLTPSHDTIKRTEMGKLFHLNFNYSEAMDTSLNPVISFPVENPSATLTYNAALSKWVSTTLFEATYDVDTTLNTLLDIDIDADGLKDTSGNQQLAFNDMDVFSIKILESGVGMDEPLLLSDLEFFPNPVKTGDVAKLKFRSRAGTMELRLYDMKGQLMEHRNISGSEGQWMVEINTGNLKTGSYIIDIRGKDQSWRGKLIVSSEG